MSGAVQAFQARDGSLHPTQSAAREHDIVTYFNAFYADVRPQLAQEVHLVVDPLWPTWAMKLAQDPFLLSLFQHRLLAIADEQNAAAQATIENDALAMMEEQRLANPPPEQPEMTYEPTQPIQEPAAGDHAGGPASPAMHAQFDPDGAAPAG